MKKRFIQLTIEEEQYLKALKKQSSSERERDRAHALLLSHQGHTIEGLSKIFDVRRATISEWLDRWEANKKAGIADAAKSGRPPIYTVAVQKK